MVVLFVLCSVQPALGQKYKVGYLEGGPFWLYTKTVEATKKALEARQWLEKISFPQDAHFSPGWDQKALWDEKARLLMARDDLSLIIVVGTDATRAILEANNGKTPIVAMAVSDPIEAGFVKSIDDSGIDNFTVRLDPERYVRMFDIFHQVVGFKKLGMIYEDTPSGRLFTNLADAQKVAKQRGFQILEYNKMQSEFFDECMTGVQWLVEQGMDAFFIPALVGFDWEQSDVNEILSYLRSKRIATFARNGSKDIMAGVLMGFSTIDLKSRGEFLAQMIVKILEGAQPRSLNMVDTGIPKISFNMAVAHEIAVNPPLDFLSATDELYQKITLPENRLVK